MKNFYAKKFILSIDLILSKIKKYTDLLVFDTTVKKAMLVLALFFVQSVAMAQSPSVGDFQSNGTGQWKVATNWLRWNGSAWATTTEYPGQNTGTGNVTILNGHTITASAIVPDLVSFGTLTVSGRLDLPGTGAVELVFNIPTKYLIVTPDKGILYFENKSKLNLGSGAVIEVTKNDNLTPKYTGIVNAGSDTVLQVISIGGFDVINGNGANGKEKFSDVLNNGGYNVIKVDPASDYKCDGPKTFDFKAVAYPKQNSVVKWYSAAGALLQTGQSGNDDTYKPTITIPGTYTYYVEASYTSPTVYTGQRKTVTATLGEKFEGFSYTNTTPSYCVGTPIAANTPTFTKRGSPEPTYEWKDGVFPAGLSLNTATGEITGTPTQAISATDYKIIATNKCETKEVTIKITVHVLPTITGALGVCVGSTTALTGSSTANGTNPWTSASTGVATVNNTGVVTGVSAGTSVITYRNSNGCTITATVTVNALPTITGTLSVCVGSTTTLTGSATANATNPWTSASTGIATVNNTGVVTGVSAGTSVITYRNSNGCTITATVTVNALPTITGTLSVCVGSTTTLTGSATANVTNPWTSASTGVATVDNTGVVTGVSAGTSVITYRNSNGCTITAIVTVNALPTITGTLSVCVGSTTTLTGSATANATNPWTSASTGVATVNNTGVVTGVSAGTSVITYRNSNGCAITVTITVNPLPVAPTVGTITHPNCVSDTGSVVLSNLPSGNWTVNPGNYTGNATTATISGLAAGTHKFTVTNANGCISAATLNIVLIAARTNTWSSSGWSLGYTPTSLDDKIVFADDYSLNEDIFGCSCTVTGSKNVVIKTGRTMKIVNFVRINDIGGVNGKGTLTFENNASLVQINDYADNSGNITYQRTTPTILKTDYVYWSSPVTGATLGAIQTGTLYYSFNAAGNSWVRGSTATVMTNALGYIVRGAGTGFDGGSISLTPNFFGKPNNGIISVGVSGGGKNNLIGNPYPSAIDADAFLRANNTVLEGTLYFWTHKSAIQLATNITNGTAGSGKYAYTSDDYATYNLTGGTGTGSASTSASGGTGPAGAIAAGQAFFAGGYGSGGQATFDNSMRLSSSGNILDNSKFSKLASDSKTAKIPTIKKIEKNRIWLNLTNTEGAFKQMLLGYVTDATNDYDRGYDAVSFNGNSFINFYSINKNSLLTIQGRALPIQETDVVPLGYSSTLVGEFSISIDKTDGLLSSMPVYLEDKLTNITHNLKSGPYTFTTEKGTFNQRFQIIYKSNVTLETADFETGNSGVIISNKNREIKIESSSEMISYVTLYDISGKLIAEKTKVNAQEMLLTNIAASKQVLLVNVTLENGQTISKKIVY